MPGKIRNVRQPATRREMMRVLGAATLGVPFAASAFGQGKCGAGYRTRTCPMSEEVATAAIQPPFTPTGWKTTALDHITFGVTDYRKEAAFYIALMGWKLRSYDGNQAVLDIGDWGSAIFREAPQRQPAVLENFCFAIEPWNAATVETELRKRGLNPMAENDGRGFESFHVKDPDGRDLQISNGNGLARLRRTPATAKISTPAPFEATGWKTVWLDHISYQVNNYKASAAFYSNLLGWKATYDEGSQHELLIGDAGDIIVRGGNPNEPSFGKGAPVNPRVDHISYGISSWDSDRVRLALEKRGLPVRVDTAGTGDIHVAAYRSYHTKTPSGYDLQISDVTHDKRLTVSNAVKPKPGSGRQ